jgi:hypothetical protein
MTKDEKELSEFEEFDRVMSGLLAVPYAELQKELAKDRKKKARKKRAKTSVLSSMLLPITPMGVRTGSFDSPSASLRVAQDFACGLPLRSRQQYGSTLDLGMEGSEIG